jgi:hypothetical protein
MPTFPFVFPFFFPGTDDPFPYEPTDSTIGALTYNAAHVAEAKAMLLEQFRGAPLIEGMVEAFVLRVQEFEDAAWGVLESMDLDKAADAQLDGLGLLVGEQRRSRDDDDYRAAIRVRILVNLCNGKHSEILNVLTTYLGVDDGDEIVRLDEPAPAALKLQVYSVPSLPSDLRVIAYEVKPAGVNLDGRYATHATRMYRFGWTSPITGVTGANNGDGWTDGSVGGYLAGRI